MLDNASIHRSKAMKEVRPVYESRGLFLFYLPPYSPHINIAETLCEYSRASEYDRRTASPPT